MIDKDKIKSLKWERWLQRKHNPFVVSTFMKGGRKKYYDDLGFKGVNCLSMFYQNSIWYESKIVWEDITKKLDTYLKDNSMFDVTKALDKFYNEKKRRIKELVVEKGEAREKLSEIYEIMSHVMAFVWLAHGLEEYFTKKLKEEVPKYVKGDIDKFIGDASFPKKKNAHGLMEDAIRNGENPEAIAVEYGWIKAREKFSEPFSADDIRELAKDVKPEEKYIAVDIPDELKQLFEEVQELVYFRTARTDVFYEFLFLSRPIIKEVGESFGILFSKVQYYSIQSLIEGNPKKFENDICFATYEDESYIGEELILKDEKIEKVDQVEGLVAYNGVVKGKAKIVVDISELDKVEEGDILVTQMTFPSYIVAMNKAKAFVTDEGSITCHAAIVAREMKKPCVTGTKIATIVFKDGDEIEVDADTGIVRKVK